MPAMSKTRLVWSDDPKDKAQLEPKPTPLLDERALANFTAVFRLERNGRGGKTVTVIDRLPKHETFVRDLCKELKHRCGSGGTYVMGPEGGTIEIQGDKRDAIKKILGDKGIKFKGS